MFMSPPTVADDLMVFCKAKTSNLQALKDLFTRYAACSGQIININKSSIYSGGVSNDRLDSIVNMLGFQLGTLPFTYLGAPIFKGRPKVIYFQPIADKIKVKLASWKASLLSMAGRTQLVKSVIQSMLQHTMSIYSWPISLLKDIERLIRNFIWSGDTEKRKLVTVSWKKVCSDFDEGGLGIKSLICLNEANNLKLCWDMIHSDESWAHLLRSRVIRRNSCISHHIYSSLWCSIKNEFPTIIDNSTWLLGNGQHINFWHDNWSGVIIADHLQVPANLLNSSPQFVHEFIDQNFWSIPLDLQTQIPLLNNLVKQVTIPIFPKDDKMV